MNVCMLISGGGTTAVSIVEAIRSRKLPGMEITCVISSNEKAKGISRLAEAGISRDILYVRNPKNFSSSESFGDSMLHIFRKHKVEVVGQYGWLPKTPENVVNAFKGNMVNQHPGPLDPGRPDFGGRGMYGKRVVAARLFFVRETNHDWWTEATSQRVADEFDKGEVLNSCKVKIFPNDSVKSLASRLLPVEHKVQIETLKQFAQGTIKEKKRIKPLIPSEELPVLEKSKLEAIKKYPTG